MTDRWPTGSRRGGCSRPTTHTRDACLPSRPPAPVCSSVGGRPLSQTILPLGRREPFAVFIDCQGWRLMRDQVFELAPELLFGQVCGLGEQRHLLRMLEVVATEPDHV